LWLPKALRLNQLLSLIANLCVEVGSGPAISCLFVAAHVGIVGIFLILGILGSFGRSPGCGGIMQLHSGILGVLFQLGFVRSIFFLLLPCLVDEFLETLVVRFQFVSFLCCLDGTIPVLQSKECLSLPMVGLHKLGIQLKAFLGILQGSLWLVQVQPHH